MTDQGLCWGRGVTPGWEPSGQVAELQNQLIDLLSGCGKAKASEDGSPLGPRQGERTVSADERLWQTFVDDRWYGCGRFCQKLLQRVCSSSTMLTKCRVGHGPSTWCGHVEKKFWSPRSLAPPGVPSAHVKDFCEQGTSVPASGLDFKWPVSKDFLWKALQVCPLPTEHM